MVGNLRAAVWAFCGGLSGWLVSATGLAQDLPYWPQGTPAPTASAAEQQYHPQVGYGPLQAGQDAYWLAEQERAWAVQRQVQWAQAAWLYPAWPPAYVTVPGVYGYVPPRVIRRAYRYGYWPVPQPVPYVSPGVYAYPYSVWLGQPPGYGQIVVGPNSVYRPYYVPPALPQTMPVPMAPSAPTPASPSTRPRQPTPAIPPREPASGPALNGPIPPAPEPIPPPPAELPQE
jgi:hypothetical protein